MAEKSPSAFNLGGIDQDGPYFRSAMWALSLLTATSAYIALKSTAIYKHYSLSDFDRSPVVLVSIFIVHVALAALSYFTRAGYLLDLRRGNPLRVANAAAWMLEFLAFAFYIQNVQLMKESQCMVFLTTLALFLLCFLRVVAPGFGNRLPLVAMGFAVAMSVRIGRAWVLMPYTVFVVTSIFLLQESDVGHAVNPCSGNM